VSSEFRGETMPVPEHRCFFTPAVIRRNKPFVEKFKKPVGREPRHQFHHPVTIVPLLKSRPRRIVDHKRHTGIVMENGNLFS